jgi:hypothetical protein
MTAPMVAIELPVIWSMYPRRKLNLAPVAASGVLLDLDPRADCHPRSAVPEIHDPHHASAILMRKQTELRDAELERLCRTIIASQQQEIDVLKTKLSGAR